MKGEQSDQRLGDLLHSEAPRWSTKFILKLYSRPCLFALYPFMSIHWATNQWFSRWWFQTLLFLFSSYLGKMNPFWLAHIFQRGWFNHQPVIFISSPLLKLTWHFTKWAFWRCIPCWKLGGIFQPSYHQTFQVPKMEVLTYISCMDTAYVRETPPPKWPEIRFRKPSILGTWNFWWS